MDTALAQLYDRLSALEQENTLLRCLLAQQSCSRLQSCERFHALLQTEVAGYRRHEQDRQEPATEAIAELATPNNTSLEHRLLEATAEVANALLTITPFDAAVNTALQILTESLDTDRVNLLENFNPPFNSSFLHWRALKYEWNSPETIPQFTNRISDKGSYQEIEWLYRLFQQGQTASYLIEEAPEPFRSEQAAIGVKSTHVVPIFVEGQWWGVLGLDDCREAKRRSSSELSVLKIAADYIGSTIHRERTQQALLQAEQERSAELAKANEALRNAIAGLARLDDLDQFLAEMLKVSIEISGAQGGTVALVEGDDIHHAVLFDKAGLVSPQTQAEQGLLRSPFSAEFREIAQRILESEDAWVIYPDEPILPSSFQAFHREQGNCAIRLVPMRIGDRLLGWLGLGFAETDPPLGKSFVLLRVLAEQMTMAVELLRLAEAAKQAAIAREQEKAALERAAELERANNALQSTVAALADRYDLQGFIGEVLHTIAREFESPLVEYWQTLAVDTVEVHTWLYSQQLCSLKQNDPHPGRGGIRLLPEQIGAEDFTHRRKLFIFNTPIPAYSLALGKVICPTEWYAERGVSRHFNFPLQVGNTTVGAISVWLPLDRQITEECLRLGQALSHQTALAIQLTHLAEEAKQAAIAREQEQVAQERAMLLERINFVLQRSTERLSAAADPKAIIVETMRTSVEVLAPLAVNGIGLMKYQPVSRTVRVMIHILDGVEQTIAGSDLDGDWSVDSPTMVVPWQRIQSENFVWGLTSDTTVLVPKVRQYHESRGSRAIAYVPLRRGKETVGWLGFDLASEIPPTSQQIEMIRALTSQVVLAVEMERLSDEARQAAIAREQEQAAQERAAELAKANAVLRGATDRLASNSSLEAFLEHVLAEACQDAIESGAIFLYEETQAHLVPVVMQGVTAGYPYSVQQPVPIAAFPVWLTLLRTKQPLVIDVNKQSDLFAGDTLAWHRIQGHQGIVLIPLMIGNQPLGMFGIASCNKVNFKETELELFQALAQQATLAIQLTQLAEAAKQAAIAREQEKAAQERAAELEKANESLQCSLNQLASDRNLESFLGHVLQGSIRVLQGTEAQIFLYHPDSHTLSPYLGVNQQGQVFAEPGIIPEYLPFSQPVPADLTPAWSRMVTQQQPIHFSLDDPDHWPGAVEWHRSHGHHGSICTAMLLGDEPIGFLGMTIRDRAKFSESELAFFQALAQQATLAIQLTRLAEEAKHAAILDERNRMAREIHDTLAQAFTGISLQLEVAKSLIKEDPQAVQQILNHISQLAEAGLTEARRSVWALYPPAAEYADLAQLLYESVEQMTRNTITSVEVNVQGTPCCLPPFIGMNLLRIGQEALTNALKHAQAETINIELAYEPDRILLTIHDNGRGFTPPNTIDHLNGGFGLVGMYERCDRIGAQLSLTSQPGQGTQILVEAPLG